MSETIVLYHGGCRDGFCAAWVVNKYFHDRSVPSTQKIEYVPAFYGKEPPDCKDKQIIIVDFCYPLETMKIILAECNSLLWLDHHKTAEPIAQWLHSITNDRVQFLFDNNRSGAGITWDYLFGDKERPWLVDYVEDRDLWLHKLPHSHKVNAYISCLEFDFELWNKVNNSTVDFIIDAGNIAIMKTDQYIREVCKNVYFADIAYPNSHNPIDYFMKIPIVNIPQVDCSEVMENLLKLYPESQFSLYWFKRADGLYQYGMRSRDEFDVSTIAKLFGGGGHKNAAGFQLKYLLEELK